MSLNTESDNVSAVLFSSDNSWNLDGEGLNVFESPDLSVFCANGITCTSKAGKVNPTNKDPLDIIEFYTNSGFFAVGYISYDYLVNTDIDVGIRDRNLFRYPQIYFNLYSKGSQCRINELYDRIKQHDSTSFLKSGNHEPRISGLNRAKYMAGVKKILEYIGNGDVYQVNLSHFISIKRKIDPLDLFIRYYKEQPVPYGMYLKCDNFHFISGSMELFLDRNCNKILTKPIKGTMGRDSDEGVNMRLKNKLYNDVKERAENLMIVDLMRNDLSRICRIGTVGVDKLFNIKDYSTLFQMESAVSGILNDNLSLKEIIHCVFPPGSVTGAPKRRSIQIIDELEEHYRGPYCGCAGVIRPDGGFTLSVSIRTAVVKDNDISYWVGSGIVNDSSAEREYLETLLKSRAFLNAIYGYE